MSPSLTAHLLQLDPPALHQATTHPFLSAAATGSLPATQQQSWLAQDRLYALTYPTFIGSLLAQLSLPPTTLTTTTTRPPSLAWRIADCLIDSLANIRAELQLFERTAATAGFRDHLGCEEPARPTRCYQDLFAGAVARGRPLLVGLVVLWATEECYLRAWSFAKAAMQQQQQSAAVEGKREEEEEEEDRDVMRRVFIPNWTSPAFAAFVARLAGLVDELFVREGVREGDEVWRECEAAWRQVLWVEAEFWPDV